MEAPIRVLIAKPGLDGHDRGALVVAQGLRDQGMEVIYTGLRQTPEQIVATAIQEDVACIGLSSLSGAHMELFPEVVRLLREQGADDILVIGGGVIPDEDIPKLKEAGIAAVFGPGSSIREMADFIRSHVRPALNAVAHPPIAVDGVDHIGIAVDNLEQALPLYVQLLGLRVEAEEVIPDQKVRATFIHGGTVELELLEPVGGDGPVAQFLKRRGPGLHHVAYAVKDVTAALAAAKAAGYTLIDEVPRRGGRGKLIGFVHPKSTGGVLLEFCQHVSEES